MVNSEATQKKNPLTIILKWNFEKLLQKSLFHFLLVRHHSSLPTTVASMPHFVHFSHKLSGFLIPGDWNTHLPSLEVPF